ncbi:MAG TPA: uroporphyrinogen-III synthase [Arachidicoccus sp.]|nr:uroporphyrinogen-III synthase [Arachidicoccus sp.]
MDSGLLEQQKNAAQKQTWAAPELEFTVMPFIQTRPITDISTSSAVTKAIQHNKFIIFTSAHAVDAVFGLLRILPEFQQNNFPDWQIYCLAGKTREAVLKHMPASAITGLADYGKDLAAKIVSDQRNNKAPEFTFFCGNIRMPTLPAMLKAGEISLEEIVVYNTFKTPIEIKEEYDGVLFFSPSAVESFFSINVLPAWTTVFSVGRTTTQAIEKYTKNKIITSSKPRASQVLAAVWKFYGHNATQWS